MFPSDKLPGVSIILPSYNRAAYILETIDSVRYQTYSNWELIIVDDGSDDNTEEIVLQLKDSRIQFYKAGRTGINGKIKNIGLEKAAGEFIAFIDSDDLWAPEKIEKQVEALGKYRDAGFSMTGGYNFKKKNEAVDYFYKQREGFRYDSVFLSLFRSEIAGYAQVLMIRRECLAIAGIFKEEKSFSDIDFIISLAIHFKAVILYEPLVYRRLHGNNYIHAHWKKSVYEGIAIINEYMKNGMLPLPAARKSLFRVYVNFGEKCLSHGETTLAIRNFIKAWRYQPFSIIPIKKTGKVILSWLQSR